MDIYNFNSYKYLINYRMEIVSKIYELEKIMRKKKENIELEFDFLKRKDRIKLGNDSRNDYWKNVGNKYINIWYDSLCNNIGISYLKSELDKINGWICDMDSMRIMSNRDCLNIILGVLNSDINNYDVVFYDDEEYTYIYIVNDNEDYILYNKCNKINDREEYLNRKSCLYYDYDGMSNEVSDKISDAILNDYIRKCGKNTRKKVL